MAVRPPEFISEAALQTRVGELAAEINRDYAGVDHLHVVGVLKGSFIFLADLIRALEIPCFVHFLRAMSYGSKRESSGEVKVDPCTLTLTGQHVLLVEDILDSGVTGACLIEELRAQQPLSLKVCVLLNKAEARRVFVPMDYVGFTIPNRFVIGYGLDFAERYRELPYIGLLDQPEEGK